MKRTKVINKAASFMLTGALLFSMTACTSDKNPGREERESTREEKPAETVVETTARITVETAIETIAETTQASESPTYVDMSADLERYRDFFANEFPQYDEAMFLSSNGIEALYAFTDLDQDGSNELLVGDDNGVYLVVTEFNGVYIVSEIYGWRVQYGAEPVEYIGDGCFLSTVYNGNNYGGEFTVSILWKYNEQVAEFGILARLSGSWDPDNLAENLSKWELYIANDEETGHSFDEYSFTPDMPDYTYSMIDYGDNYQFVDGERVYNELEDQFYAYVEAHRQENAMSGLIWLPVSGYPV